jgi:hypothetical protein
MEGIRIGAFFERSHCAPLSRNFPRATVERLVLCASSLPLGIDGNSLAITTVATRIRAYVSLAVGYI